MYLHDGIKNPLNDFDFFADSKKTQEDKFIWMRKNLQAHFFKLCSCAINVIQVQHDYLDGGKDNSSLDKNMFTVNSVEYFFIKVNTIFELCYQMYDYVDERSEKKKKFKRLNEDFEKYIEDTGSDINLAWYQEINDIRNHIIHSGYGIKTFEEESRFLFQAYADGIQEKVLPKREYSKNGSTLVYIDRYMEFHIKIVHWYIEEFFKFVLHLIGSRVDESKLSSLQKELKNSGSCVLWSVSGIDVLKRLNAASAV